MMRARLLLAMFFLLAPAAASAVEVQTLPAPKGEDIWFVEDHTLPMIAMSAALPAGSAYDPKGKEGLAAFAAAMLDEGAGNLNSQAYHEALSDRAIRLSVTPGRDYTVITLVTLSENAKEAFRLLGLALSHPRFDPDAIARVRGQILTDIQGGQEEPETVAQKAFFRAFFKGHPYGHPVDGDAASVGRIGRGDLQAFARGHWVRGGLKIAVAGDVSADDLAALLGSAFDKLPNVTPAAIPPVRHMGAPGVIVVPMPVPQSTVIFGLPGIPRNDRDFIAAYVANNILGGGDFSSRLMNEVREKRGLTYGISTNLLAYRRGGFVVGEVATRREAIRQTIDVLKKTVRQFAADGPTDRELADAKTYLTGSFPLAFSSNAGIAGQLSTFQTQGLPANYISRRNDLINALTAADVKRAARRMFSGRLTIVVAGSVPAAAKPAARPQGH